MPEDEFYKCKSAKDGLYPRCPACHERSRLKILYGITPEQYDEIFRRQAGSCAICRQKQEDLNVRLGVDHDHKTGRIRGLLCGRCDLSIGKFEDNVELLEAAMVYLKFWKQL